MNVEEGSYCCQHQMGCWWWDTDTSTIFLLPYYFPLRKKLLSLGIEDTFRTAATEVSLLAGSEEFNATKLFEVGKWSGTEYQDKISKLESAL